MSFAGGVVRSNLIDPEYVTRVFRDHNRVISPQILRHSIPSCFPTKHLGIGDAGFRHEQQQGRSRALKAAQHDVGLEWRQSKPSLLHGIKQRPLKAVPDAAEWEGLWP